MVYAQDLLENIEQAALFFAKGGDPFNFYGNGIGKFRTMITLYYTMTFIPFFFLLTVMNTFYAVEGWNTYSFLQNSFGKLEI